jgi:hypothetical protein
MKTFVMLTVACLVYGLATPARAQDDSPCEKLTDFAYRCPKPTRPDGPPKCHLYGPDDQICDRPLTAVPQVTYTKPSNCGWNKAGKYICW